MEGESKVYEFTTDPPIVAGMRKAFPVAEIEKIEPGWWKVRILTIETERLTAWCESYGISLKAT